MAGEGSIQGMIISLRNNKNLLRPKRSFLNQKKEFLKAANGEINFKKATKKELEKIREKIYKERKRQRKINIGIWSVTAIFLISIAVVFTKNISQQNYNSEKKAHKAKTEKYYELIEDGDQWLKKGNWHNAIFQYKKAKEVFPTEYDINYRLTYVFCLSCEAEYINCKEAKENLDKLIVAFPEKQELFELKKLLKYEY